MADAPPMLDKNNIINVREGKSLYQICTELRKRLSGVPGFEPYLYHIKAMENAGNDPVSSLWQCFRSGVPLLTIYNASQPEGGPLIVKTPKQERQAKEATFLFLKACIQDLKIASEDTFSVTELYNDNTNGFMKVTKLVNKVLDILQLSGHLDTNSDGSVDESGGSNGQGRKMTQRDHIVKELLDSERHYVHHLQNLMTVRNDLDAAAVLTGDSIHNIFLNLGNILDFAQRFLIRVEQHNELPEMEQNWGALFLKYKEPFRQYEPFISNQRRCEITVTKEWAKMKGAIQSDMMGQMLRDPTILNGFLLKPFQRMTKYPLLLKDLEKQLTDPERKHDLLAAVSAIQEVLASADQAIDKDTREDALEDLKERVDDWKGLDKVMLGELLMFDTFTVIKDGALRGSEEREYHIYLFERILVMSKDVNISKQRKRGLQSHSVRGRPKMHIKGRIYLANVSNTNSYSAPGSYQLSINWQADKGDMMSENFVIKFKNDESLKKWAQSIEIQRSVCMMAKNGQGTTSNTTLTSMANIKGLKNPYKNEDDEAEEGEDLSRMSSTTLGAESEMNMSRVGSSTSLRQRSATNSSASSSNPHHSLSRTARMNGMVPLNTSMVYSPSSHPGESYFSPIDENTPPPSARSSQQSTLVNYRSGTSMTGVLAGPEPHNQYRRTAPAMGRNDLGGNPYLPVRGGRPTMPGGPTTNRMRSASSPDIHPDAQRYRRGEPVPAVPSIPQHVSKEMGGPNRSQNNSPVYNNLRAPNGMRPQLPGHGYTYDPSSYGMQKIGHTASKSTEDVYSPEASTVGEDEDDMPSQLRAKVQYLDNYVSMIIGCNITFRSLCDRIDAKLSRLTTASIASGTIKLKYRDEDGDMVLIDSDEAVSEALLDWKETHMEQISQGLPAELMLHAQSQPQNEHAVITESS